MLFGCLLKHDLITRRIAIDPNIEWVQQGGKPGAQFTNKGNPIRFQAEGNGEGVPIRVVIEPLGEGIITGFPTMGKGARP